MPGVTEIIRKILNFEKEPVVGWKTPKATDINTAISIASFGDRVGIQRFNAFACYGGTITVNFYIGDRDMEVWLGWKDDLFDVGINDDIYIEDIGLAEVLESIKKFAGGL